MKPLRFHYVYIYLKYNSEKLCPSHVLSVCQVYSLCCQFFCLSFSFSPFFGRKDAVKSFKLVDGSASAAATEISGRKPLIYWENLSETNPKTHGLNRAALPLFELEFSSKSLELKG